MSAKIAARVLLALGFLAASVSYSSWIVSRTVLDPSATRSATHALLTAPAVRATLARDLHNTLSSQLGHAAQDPKLNTAIAAAVADPRFVNAFDDAIVSLQQSVLSDKGGRVTLNGKAVTAALRGAVANHDPALQQQVKSLGTVTFPLDKAKLPHIGGATRTVGRVGDAAAAIAIALIAGALVLAHDRKMVGRVGRRTAMLALAPVLIFWLIPHLIAGAHGAPEEVISALLHAYAHRVLPSAAAFVVIGVSIWLVSLAVPVFGRGHHAAEPAAAAAAPPPYPGMPRPYRADEPTAPLPEKLYL